MEETNYHRSSITGLESKGGSGTETPSGMTESHPGDEKFAIPNEPAVTETGLCSEERYKTKTYVDKLKRFDRKHLALPNRLGEKMLRPLIFLSFPVIFYADFSYGSNLVWFNVLNGTASLILLGKPYNFASSMVGLSYVSPLLGVIVG